MKSDCHTVSMVIPTLGRTTVNLCKSTLSKQTRLPDEVIVVRDHENRGAGWARNEGIRQAQGYLIGFIDDDCLPPGDWLERLIQAVDKYNAAVAGGTYEETDVLLKELRSRRNLRRMFPEKEEMDTIGLVGAGGNLIYKRSWLDACSELDGYIFDESFKTAQDWELAWRLRRRGAKLIFIPTTVTHLRRVTPFKYLRRQFDYVFSPTNLLVGLYLKRLGLLS